MQISKGVNSQYLGHIGPDHYAIGSEDTSRQGEFAGGPKVENNKSTLADGRHLGIEKQVYRPFFDRFASNLVWPYESYWALNSRWCRLPS